MIHLLKKKFQKICELIYTKRLPSASNLDLQLISELQNEASEIELIETSNLSGSELQWSNNVNTLLDNISRKDPREFLSWDVIRNTMFVSWAKYISIELNEIRQSADFDQFWKNALAESLMGKPLRYYKYPESSENLIHHVYHLLKFREYVNIHFQEADIIFEFGGGYGSMCRVLHNCDFDKKYIIFDLPVFSALQKFYLKSIGLKVLQPSEYITSQNGIICISDFEVLSQIIDAVSINKRKLFIATWSFSETPYQFRRRFISMLSTFDYFLIAYQENFNEIDNRDYFMNFKEAVSGVQWTDIEIQHLKKNYYLFGKAI